MRTKTFIVGLATVLSGILFKQYHDYDQYKGSLRRFLAMWDDKFAHVCMIVLIFLLIFLLMAVVFEWVFEEIKEMEKLVASANFRLSLRTPRGSSSTWRFSSATFSSFTEKTPSVRSACSPSSWSSRTSTGSPISALRTPFSSTRSTTSSSS